MVTLHRVVLCRLASPCPCLPVFLAVSPTPAYHNTPKRRFKGNLEEFRGRTNFLSSALPTIIESKGVSLSRQVAAELSIVRLILVDRHTPFPLDNDEKHYKNEADVHNVVVLHEAFVVVNFPNITISLRAPTCSSSQ